MPKKKACLVMNPHGVQNLAQLPGVLALLNAAHWKTRLTIKEFAGQARDLAQEAAERCDDLLIAYGGDGTLNQVINGAMNVGYSGVVGVLPGGTANVWATEVGVPANPIKAALTLVNSTARPVDIGHVAVTELAFPETTATDGDGGEKHGHQDKRDNDKARSNARQHFLLMAGLGIDAAIMGAVSKPLKYRIGPLAVGLAAAKVLPEHRPFPLEIWNTRGDACDQVLWKGEALQVIIGNTRLYAKVVEMTPDATIDDGALDVCVITAGEPLTTLQQITSLLLRRTPAEMTAQYFKGAHLALRIPASIPLQIDGSAAKLKDYLGPRNRQRLEQAEQLDQVFVTYRFDALPHALQLLIPRDYDDTLFEQKQDSEPAHTQTAEDRPLCNLPEQTEGERTGTEQPGPPTHLKVAQRLSEHGRTIKTLGVSPLPERKNTLLIAGSTISRQTGEEKPVALYVNEKTIIVDRDGRLASPTRLRGLEDGKEVMVEGKKDKRGIIKATGLLI